MPAVKFLFGVPELSSDVRLDGIDDFRGLQEVHFGAPEILCKRGFLGLVPCLFFLVGVCSSM